MSRLLRLAAAARFTTVSCWPCHGDFTIVLQIADYGLCAFGRGADPLSSIVGSPTHMAPEVLARRPYEGSQVKHYKCRETVLRNVPGKVVSVRPGVD